MMNIVKSLIITVSLMINVLAEEFNTEKLLGTWRVIAGVHNNISTSQFGDSCIKFTFGKLNGDLLSLKEQAVRNSENIHFDTTVKIVESVIQTIPSSPNEPSYKMNILDFTAQGDLVLFLQNSNLYLLMSRGMHITDEIYQKYLQYVKYGWKLLLIIHKDCF